MTPIDAQIARRNAKFARHIASHEQFLPAVPRNLSFEPFGEKLATDVALSLKAGILLQGRVKFDFRMGIMSISTQEVWSLSVDTTTEDTPNTPNTPTEDTPTEDIEELALVWRFGVDVVTSWTTVEDFVRFWAVMSEQKIAALLVGINAAPDKVINVNGTVTRTQLKQFVRPALAMPAPAMPAPAIRATMMPAPAIAHAPVQVVGQAIVQVHGCSSAPVMAKLGQSSLYRQCDAPTLAGMAAELPFFYQNDSDMARELQALEDAIHLDTLESDSQLAREMQAMEWQNYM